MWHPLTERPERKEEIYLIWDHLIPEYKLVAIDVWPDGSWEWSFPLETRENDRYEWAYLPPPPERAP